MSVPDPKIQRLMSFGEVQYFLRPEPDVTQNGWSLVMVSGKGAWPTILCTGTLESCVRDAQYRGFQLMIPLVSA